MTALIGGPPADALFKRGLPSSGVAFQGHKVLERDDTPFESLLVEHEKIAMFLRQHKLVSYEARRSDSAPVKPLREIYWNNVENRGWIDSQGNVIPAFDPIDGIFSDSDGEEETGGAIESDLQ